MAGAEWIWKQRRRGGAAVGRRWLRPRQSWSGWRITLVEEPVLPSCHRDILYFQILLFGWWCSTPLSFHASHLSCLWLPFFGFPSCLRLSCLKTLKLKQSLIYHYTHVIFSSAYYVKTSDRRAGPAFKYHVFHRLCVFNCIRILICDTREGQQFKFFFCVLTSCGRVEG